MYFPYPASSGSAPAGVELLGAWFCLKGESNMVIELMGCMVTEGSGDFQRLLEAAHR